MKLLSKLVMFPLMAVVILLVCGALLVMWVFGLDPVSRKDYLE